MRTKEKKLLIQKQLWGQNNLGKLNKFGIQNYPWIQTNLWEQSNLGITNILWEQLSNGYQMKINKKYE